MLAACALFGLFRTEVGLPAEHESCAGYAGEFGKDLLEPSIVGVIAVLAGM